MGAKTQSGEENDGKISPANARPSLFVSGDTGFEPLAILRGIRTLGRNKLDLQEAIAVALEQGAAFERWNEKKTPIGQVQVWVDGQLKMTVKLEETTINLKSFSFYVASPHHSVMQIVKADEDQEPIVLRNLALGTVGADGLVDTTLLPNGQICLRIAPPSKGRFDVTVAFAERTEVSLLSDQPFLGNDQGDFIRSPDNHESKVFDQPVITGPFWATASVVWILVAMMVAAFTWYLQPAINNEPEAAPKIRVTLQPSNETPNATRRTDGRVPIKWSPNNCCDQQVQPDSRR